MSLTLENMIAMTFFLTIVNNVSIAVILMAMVGLRKSTTQVANRANDALHAVQCTSQVISSGHERIVSATEKRAAF